MRHFRNLRDGWGEANGKRRRAPRARPGLPRLALLALLVACGAPPQPVAQPEPAPPPPADSAPHPLPFAVVWTARSGVPLLQGEGEGTYFLRPFTRLEVLGGEGGGIRVRCDLCPTPVEANVSWNDVVISPLPPAVAAWGTLAEFALAVRAAAEAHDLAALEPVMVRDFSYSLVGLQTAQAALDTWRSEGFTTLELVPRLLDQGLSTRDSVIWSAPPAYTDDLHYRGHRLGFRKRADGGWEWLFLIGGVRPS